MNKIIYGLAFTVIVLIFSGAARVNAQPIRTDKNIPASRPVSDNEKEAIEKIVHDYLIKNPAVIREAMQALQEQEKKESDRHVADSIKNLRSEIYSDPDSPVLGNSKGDVQIVVFFDYFCGYCKKTLPDLQVLMAKDSSVRLVYKEFPIMGSQSYDAARAALAANRQGKFAEFHLALIQSKGASEDVIKEISDRLNLNYADLRKDMNDPKIIGAIDRNIRLAESLDIRGTPVYLVGDQFISGAIDYDSLVRVIKAERLKLLARP